jgi:hypothetical protein
MNCHSCLRRAVREEPPRGWRVSGGDVLCRECISQRYRIRSIRAVVEPVAAAWWELRAAVEKAPFHGTPGDRLWEATITERQPLLRVLIRGQWRDFRLKSAAAWSGGRRSTYEKLAAGTALDEIVLYRAATGLVEKHVDGGSEIRCRIVAWLPREQMENAGWPQDSQRSPARQRDPIVHQLDEEIDIKCLRDAIRSNCVTFPSQVPTFSKHQRPDLQRKLAQLYFVLGWNCKTIAARYGLSPSRVGQILNEWKRRAVKTGYIQQIPPSDVIGRLAMLGAPRDTKEGEGDYLSEKGCHHLPLNSQIPTFWYSSSEAAPPRLS